MLGFTKDKGVFIRSMASRGRLGGLSKATFSCISLMDAFGFDKIIVETVGAGQSEVDIIHSCDTTIVLSVPGLGDEIQIIKAGIMEIADIFSVNKADLPGSDELANQINSLIDLIPSTQSWIPPIILTNSLNQVGISKIVDKIEDHWNYLTRSDDLSRRREMRLANEVIFRLNESISLKVKEGENSLIKKSVTQILEENITPLEAVKRLLSELLDTKYS